MDMKRYLSMMVYCLGALNLAAQHAGPLKPGDWVPDDLVSRHMVNYGADSMHLVDFEGKAILLDFGTTYCPPCITSLVKLDALQKEFPNNLRVFMVTHESKEKVTAFLQNNMTVKGVQVPVIAQDTLLHDLFRHITLPHIVWIGKDRKVKALTGHHYVDKENISALIEGEPMDWPVKWDFPYDYSKAMIAFNGENFNTVMRPEAWQYSIVTNHIEGVVWRQKTTVDSAAKQIRVSAFNIPLLKMYLSLFGYIWEHNFQPAQVVLQDVQDPAPFFYDEHLGPKAVWERSYTYCYEMTFPMGLDKEERNRRIIEQLNWHFGLKVDLKKLKRPCWVMVVSDRDRLMRRTLFSTEAGHSIKGLLNAVNKIPHHAPMINELNLEESVEKSIRLELTTGLFDSFEALKKVLEPQGISLEVQVREVESLWIEPAK